jgi:hypothetical protein
MNAQGTPGVTTDIISENTLGARIQLEVDAPIDFVESGRIVRTSFLSHGNLLR